MFIYVVLSVSGDQKVDGSGLISACCCAFSLERKLYSLYSLFNQVYKWVLGKNTGSSPAVNYHPSQGGLVILLVALWYIRRSLCYGCDRLIDVQIQLKNIFPS